MFTRAGTAMTSLPLPCGTLTMPGLTSGFPKVFFPLALQKQLFVFPSWSINKGNDSS